MKKSFFYLIRHPLISGSVIVLVGSLIANLFNYFFNLLLGRFLVVSDYGIYATLISFMGLFGIFPSTFTTIFAKFAAIYKAKDTTQNMGSLMNAGSRIILFFGLAVLILLFISIFSISSFLHIQDLNLLALMFLTIFLSIVTSLPMGILQGEMRLYTTSLVVISTPFFKIFIGLLLLLLGFKILGVTIAIFISSLLTFLLLLSFFKYTGKKQKSSVVDQSHFIKEIKKYSFAFFFSMLGISILTSTDIMFVKHYFSPEEAGQYAALSVMGKSILYLTSPIYFVFFPLIAQKKERNENIYSTLLLAIFIITLCSVSLSFIYFLFPTIILDIFFPAKEYRILTSYLGPFSLYVIIFSIAMLFNNFLLSIGHEKVYIINLLVSIIFIILMIIFHSSFFQIIAVLFFTSLLLLTLYLLYYASTIYAKK